MLDREQAARTRQILKQWGDTLPLIRRLEAEPLEVSAQRQDEVMRVLELKRNVDGAVDQLEPKAWRVLHMRYADGLSWAAIAAMLCYDVSHVRVIERAALEAIYTTLCAHV